MKLNLKIDHHENILKIVGPYDRNLNVIKSYFDIKLTIRENEIITNAKKEVKDKLEILFEILLKLIIIGVIFNEKDIVYIIKLIERNIDTNNIINFYQKRNIIITTNQGRAIYPKTINQQTYIDAINKNDLVFGVGPAGTGKTYLAVAYASKLLKENKIKKIILTRPVVEAGESLGFLPGDIKEKIDPYLIPLYDALYEFLGRGTVDNLIEKGVIEIAPLAYMRGRTLDNAFVILDEAQNTTKVQMKMFLTRLGFNSKMLISGDPSQIDLKNDNMSGLIEVIKILKNLEDVKFINFEKLDVIRNPLVQKVLERYDENKLS